jgi:WD40 repeat protein
MWQHQKLMKPQFFNASSVAVVLSAGGDRPFLISGADDRLIKVWDYQTKHCVHTLEGHAHNISAVAYHPELPVILSASEDGCIKMWHATTYRCVCVVGRGGGQQEPGWLR